MPGSDAAHLKEVFRCVREADAEGPIAGPGADSPVGLSGRKTIGLLQRLARLLAGQGDACYLEIGVYQGASLLAVAAAAPRLACFGIDDFSLLDPKGENLRIVEGRLARLGAKNATLVNLGFEEALADLARVGGRKIGLYFADGPHDYRSQLMALMLALPHLDERAVVVVDDANYPFVRQATRDFLLAQPRYKMVFEAYSPAHPANMDPQTRRRHEAGWLNGVHVLARDDGGLLPDMLPPADPRRELYVNEWLIHRHALAELAPEALELAGAACRGDAPAEAAARARLLGRYRSMKHAFDGRFPDRNVYSEGLPERRFNRAPS
jgi:predicted O-methyltransferase YrrM